MSVEDNTAITYEKDSTQVYTVIDPRDDIVSLSSKIKEIEDPQAKMEAYSNVLTSEEFLEREEDTQTLQEFLQSACNEFKGVFRKLQLVDLMEKHLETTDMIKYPHRQEYMKFEKDLHNRELEKIVGKVHNPRHISYEGFYYPNYIVNQENILNSRLVKDLKNPNCGFSCDELEMIRDAILKSEGKPLEAESLVLGMIEEKLSSMFSF